MKKNLTKLMALGLVVVMGATAAVGCGSKDSDGGSKTKDGKTKLTMALWDETQQKVMQKMIDKYEEENPNVTVETQLSTWSEYWTKLEASATGNDACDIMWMNILHVEEYVEAGILKDLSKVGENLDMETNFPAAIADGYTIDGKLYAIPKDFDTNGLFYNKELFDKAGLAYPTDDWTMEDFWAACKALDAADLGEGVYPTAVNYNSGQTNFNATIIANGGYVYNDDYTATGYSDPKTVEGITIWSDLVKEGYSPTLQQMTDTTPDAMFEAGKIAMYMSGNYMIAEYEQNENIAGKYDVVSRPSFNGKKTDIINGLGYSVYEGTKNEEEALKFVEWLGGKEAMDIQGSAGSVISARNESQELYLETRPELNLQVFLANLEETHVLPHCKATSEIGTVTGEYMQKVWSGEMTMEDAGKKIDEETKPILEKMNSK